jgi:flavodoxin
MKVLIIYDSVYGNTLRVAEMYQMEFQNRDIDAELVHAERLEWDQYHDVSLVIFGSPTRGFRAMPTIIRSIRTGAQAMKDHRIAIFDTRIETRDIQSKVLRKLIGAFGYGTDHISKVLKKHGFTPVVTPKGYAVMSAEGPLKPEVAYEVQMDVIALTEHLEV